MTFTKPGAYTYHCTPHPHMTATIIVTAASAAASANPTHQPATTGVSGGATTVFARGLDNPKGLAFAPNGDLYVAESGHSDGTCPRQTSSANSSAGVSGAVARITPSGKVTRVITGLLSQCEAGQYIGPTGVSFVTQTLYVAQGSCLGQYPGPASPCLVSQPVLRMTPGGAPSAVAQFVLHTLSNQEYGFTHEDPYGIVTGPDGALYVSDGHRRLLGRQAAGPVPPRSHGDRHELQPQRRALRHCVRRFPLRQGQRPGVPRRGERGDLRRR